MNIKKWIAQLNFYLFLLLLAFISFYDLLMIYILDLWFLSYIVDFILNKRWADLKLKRRYSIFFFYALIYFISLITLFYSENQGRGWLIILRQLPIFVISIIGFVGLNDKYNLEKSLKALIIGYLISCCIILIYALFNSVILGYNRGNLLYSSGIFFQEVIGIFKHRAYFGMVGLFSLVSISYLFFKYKLTRIEIYTFASGILLIVSIILLSETRMAIMTFFCLLILIPLYEGKSIINSRQRIIIIFILVAILCIVFITFIPKYYHILAKELSQTEGLLRNEPRILIWKDTWQLIKSHWCFGVGIGDVQEIQNEIFHQHNIFQDVDIQYNAHNQFMQTMLEGGILALTALILAIGGTIYVSIKNQNYLVLFYSFILIMSFIVETVLHRITGIILFTITPLMLLLNQDNSIKDVSQYRNRRNVFFIFIQILIIFSFVILVRILFLRPQFDPKSPATFASQPYELISYQDLNNNSLPEGTNGFKIDEKYFLKYNDEKGHSYMLLLSKKVKDQDSVVASLNCKIAENFENGIVGFAIGGPIIGYDIAYADTNIKTWQELKVNKKFYKSDVKVVIILNSTNNNTSPTGSIIFAYPKIEIYNNLAP